MSSSVSEVEVNCWALARRYFFEAMASDPERTRPALALINALFRIERGLADAPRKKREATRKSKSKPLLDHLFSWCEANIDHVLDDTPIKAEIRSALNQRDGLRRFLQDDATVAWNLIQHSPRSHEEIWDHSVWATKADPTWGGFAGNVEAWLLAGTKGTFPPRRG